MNLKSVKKAIPFYLMNKIQDFVNANWLKYNLLCTS